MHHNKRNMLLLAVVLLPACRTGLNYPSLEGPRYTGGPAEVRLLERSPGDTLKLVSFNIKYAIHVDRAIALLESEPALRGADVIMLQEMDEAGTKRVADALGFWYAYYPATLRLNNQRDFGNAVLSRWPIVEDRKIVLPHTGRFTRTQRIATAATVQVGESLVRVYSAHLGTIAEIGPGSRRDQLRAIIADAEGYSCAIIGGDMNSSGTGRAAREAGFAWPTERGPRTALSGRLDHIFLKGLAVPDSAAAGTVLDQRGASDHRPVWAVGIIR